MIKEEFIDSSALEDCMGNREETRVVLLLSSIESVLSEHHSDQTDILHPYIGLLLLILEEDPRCK